MAERFPPRADKAAVECLEQFAQGIAENPWRYMLDISDAETIGAVVGALTQAHALSSNPATRNELTVRMKDEARARAEILCQGYRNRIRHNRGISDVDKLAIHVTPVNNSRSKIYVEKSLPIITVLSATLGEHHLRYADSKRPSSTAKAPGAQFLDLFYIVSDSPATNRDNAKRCGSFSRPSITVKFDNADNGRTATYWGRWHGKHNGDVGPWSLPVSMTIAA